jgi:hypothetical protein
MELLGGVLEFQGENSFKEGRVVTPVFFLNRCCVREKNSYLINLFNIVIISNKIYLIIIE